MSRKLTPPTLPKPTYETALGQAYLGDSLDVLPSLPDGVSTS